MEKYLVKEVFCTLQLYCNYRNYYENFLKLIIKQYHIQNPVIDKERIDMTFTLAYKHLNK